MISRKIEKTSTGYDLVLFGSKQYVSGKDAVISELLQRLLLIKGELTFDFPTLAYNESIGVPVFDKLNQFEWDLEIKKIILSVPEIYNINHYRSNIVTVEGKTTYVAEFTLSTTEGDVQWQITV